MKESLSYSIDTIGALDARGVGFRSLSESIDTTTSGGRLVFHVFGALGQFERDLIGERTKAGLAAAARGRKGGRKPVVTADKLRRAREHLANGLNVREATARLKIGKTSLYAALQAASEAELLTCRAVAFSKRHPRHLIQKKVCQIIPNFTVSLQNKALSKSIRADLVNLQDASETPPSAPRAAVAMAA